VAESLQQYIHDLAFKTICGESTSVTPDMVQKWHEETLPQLLDQYQPSVYT